MAIAREAAQPQGGEGAARARADRIYFGAMALICGVAILGGFTPSFFLRSTLMAGAFPLRPTVITHGALFTVWVALFLTQTALISARRRDWHRRLGLLGLAVVPAMAAVGTLLIAGFERSHGVEPPLTFAVHVLGNGGPLSLFVAFAAAGLWWRREPAVHKRLMLFATLALEPAGFARLIAYFGFGQSPNVPCFGVLCLSCVVYDLCVDRRVRPVTLVGVLLLFGQVYVTDLLFAYIESAPA
jgi:uncharacterized membrane protein YhaH (DUF805 family)